MQRTCGRSRASDRTSSAVPSGESSSTKITSHAWLGSTASSPSRSASTLSRSLKVGTITDSRGEAPGRAARPAPARGAWPMATADALRHRSLIRGLTGSGGRGTLRAMVPDAPEKLARFIQSEVAKDPRQPVLPATPLDLLRPRRLLLAHQGAGLRRRRVRHRDSRRGRDRRRDGFHRADRQADGHLRERLRHLLARAMPLMPETLKEVVLEHYRREPERLYVRCLMPDGAVAPVTYADLVARGSQFAAAARSARCAQGRHRDRHPAALARPVLRVLRSRAGRPGADDPGAAELQAQPRALPRGARSAAPAHRRPRRRHRRGRRRALVGAKADRLGTAHACCSRGELPPDAAAVPDVSPAADDLVLLQHSSGSTGLKKGVALSNRAVLQQIRELRADAAPGEGRRDRVVASPVPRHGPDRLHDPAGGDGRARSPRSARSSG